MRACFTAVRALSVVAAGWAGVASQAATESAPSVQAAAPLTKLAYNNPGLLVDLGVGLWGWPLPVDYNHDGLMDLVVVCTGKPSNGTWFFENTGEIDPETKLPVFKAGVKIDKSVPAPQFSLVDGKPVITSPGQVYPDFLNSGFRNGVRLPLPLKIQPGPGNVRTTQLRLVDYFGRGTSDAIIGIDDWGDYGWDNAYDSTGGWKNGPLRGFVYLLKNEGTNTAPQYAPPVKVEAAGAPVEVYGQPSPCFGDFRGSGKLDLICGEFREGFTYYENIGTRSEPRYAAGKRLIAGGKLLATDLCMTTPVACDFNGDGHLDLVVGDEDGRVALIENTGQVVDGVPQFLPPRYFRQQAENVKMGALTAPAAYDWYGTGREDLIVGNSAGYIGVIRNLGGNPPRWAAPVYLSAGGKIIRSQAGPNGSVQGPAEAKWGYTNVSVVDWDGDGKPDILVDDIWGKIVWYRNIGTRTSPRLAAAEPLTVAWEGPTPKPAWLWWNPKGKELVTQWRCTPCAVDLNGDGLPDLVTLDPDGYLVVYERRREPGGRLVLLPPKRMFWGDGISAYDEKGLPQNHQSGLLRMNAGAAGKSGRRTFCFVDWDGDGVLDLLVNSAPNVNFLKGMGKDASGRWVFRDMGPLHPQVLTGHSTTPTAVHWANHTLPDLLIGAEDGFFYQLPNPNSPKS